MKLTIWGIAFFCLSQFSYSDEKDEKLDSIITLSNEIKDEVKKKSPIHDKYFGIEVNPVMPLLVDEGFLFTGGVQFFGWDRNAEISFPFQIGTSDDDEIYTLDVHYRRFLGDYQRGFYLSGFIRSSYVETFYYDDDFEETPFNDTRFGIGAGLGYRIYSRSGLYWGLSLNLGRYLFYEEPENTLFSGFLLGSVARQIIDIEFFKFGFAF